MTFLMSIINKRKGFLCEPLWILCAPLCNKKLGTVTEFTEESQRDTEYRFPELLNFI
jgi:hypothetical protein